MEYGFNEYADMLLCLGQANGVANEAARAYAIQFPNRRHPDAKVIRRAEQRLRETGQLMPLNIDRGRHRNIRTPALEQQVLAAIYEAPGRGIRGLAQEFDVSCHTVQRILADEQLHPYHYRQVQALQPDDFPARQQFCEWLINRHENDPNFVSSILWTDESYFSRDGVFNMHNNHQWALQNPHTVRVHAHQQRFGLNVWAGILGNFLIGPFVFPERLSADIFRDFLQNDLDDLLENVPLAVRRRMWLQMDGAPAHYGRNVREWCQNNYPDRWIGRGGAIAWPARSPDITPCDFFLWGHLKSLVYNTIPIANVHELRQRLNAALDTITVPMLQRVQENIVRRLNLCIEMDGGHFEHLL